VAQCHRRTRQLSCSSHRAVLAADGSLIPI
jgi:hypothetical protein